MEERLGKDFKDMQIKYTYSFESCAQIWIQLPDQSLGLGKSQNASRTEIRGKNNSLKHKGVNGGGYRMGAHSKGTYTHTHTVNLWWKSLRDDQCTLRQCQKLMQLSYKRISSLQWWLSVCYIPRADSVLFVICWVKGHSWSPLCCCRYMFAIPVRRAVEEDKHN